MINGGFLKRHIYNVKWGFRGVSLKSMCEKYYIIPYGGMVNQPPQTPHTDVK